MRARVLVAAALLLFAPPAQSLSSDPSDEVIILRRQLEQVRGTIAFGGVNMVSAIVTLADALIDVEKRLKQMERRTCR